MSKLFYKGKIEDIENINCTDDQVHHLCDLCINLAKKIASIGAREVYFCLSDFKHIKKELKDFCVSIDQRKINDHVIWFADFHTKNDSVLRLQATLEKA